MPPASTVSTAAYIYKRLYMGNRPSELAMRDHPLYSMIKKVPNNFGEEARYPLKVGNTQGVSGTLSAAQTATRESFGVQMAMTPAVKYGVITLDGVSILRSRDNKSAFLKLTTNETESILEEVGDSCAFDLYRTSNATRGQRLSIATNTVTLAEEGSARNFKLNMTVIASPNANGSAPRAGNTTVAAVNIAANTVTLTSAAAIVGFLNNDFLFRLGDPGTAVQGLEEHFPLVSPVPAVDSFRGVDRGAFPELLAGVRIDDVATTIEENAGLTGIQISQNGKRADALFVNPINYWNMVRRANAKVEFQGAGGTAGYGFEYFPIYTPAGTLKCYSDPDCPVNRGRVLKMEDACLAHADAPVHVIMDDGRPTLRSTADDGIETRVRSVTNPYFMEPAAHGVFSI